MPRLLLVSHNYAPEPTGIPYYNTGMAEWFVRRGWEVEVLTGMPHYPWWQVPADYAERDYREGRADEVINGVMVRRVRHFVPRPPVGGLARIRLDASYMAAWMRRSLSLKERPALILGVAPPFLIGGLLLWLRSRWQVPTIYHAQDLQVDAALELGMLPGWLSGTLRLVERVQLERVDLVTACGRGMLTKLAAKGRLRQPPRHWPNWADCETMCPWDDARDGVNPERAALDGGRPGSTVVLYSGNLGRKQGLEVLIEAAGRMHNHPHVRTVLAGAGAEQESLATRCAELPNVSLQDLRPVARLRAFLAAADLHVITQRREATDLVLPSKLLNILAVGRPVVVTADVGSELHQVVTESGAGLVVPPGDAAALAAALATLADDPARRAAMGAAGRQWICTHLSADMVLGRMESDILALAEAGRQPRRTSPRKLETSSLASR